MEAFPLEKDPTADEVTDIFVNEIVKRHAYPRAMTCDRGSNLMQGSVEEYYKASGIQLVTNDSYMHNTAGLVERFNGTLKDILKGFLQDVDEDADRIGARWWRYLTYALLSYNTSEATSTGYSPFYLMYGRDARMPLQNTLLPPPAGQELTYSDHVAQHLKLLHSAWEAAQQQSAAAAAVSRQQQNLSRDINFNLKPGDRVLIRKPNLQGLEVPYAGPFRVAQVLEDDRVQLRDLHRVMHDEFHISRLKLYPYVDNDGNVAADREEYIIKEIKDHRQLGDETEYLVRWEGWDSSSNSWAHESEFNEHALELVQAYWQRLNGDTQTTARGDGLVHSTVEAEPISRAPALRSHREDHLEAAPEGFVPDSQAAPDVAVERVGTAKAKAKQKKLKKGQKTTHAKQAAAAAAPSPSAASAEPLIASSASTGTVGQASSPSTRFDALASAADGPPAQDVTPPSETSFDVSERDVRCAAAPGLQGSPVASGGQAEGTASSTAAATAPPSSFTRSAVRKRDAEAVAAATVGDAATVSPDRKEQSPTTASAAATVEHAVATAPIEVAAATPSTTTTSLSAMTTLGAATPPVAGATARSEISKSTAQTEPSGDVSAQQESGDAGAALMAPAGVSASMAATTTSTATRPSASTRSKKKMAAEKAAAAALHLPVQAPYAIDFP